MRLEFVLADLGLTWIMVTTLLVSNASVTYHHIAALNHFQISGRTELRNDRLCLIEKLPTPCEPVSTIHFAVVPGPDKAA